jgi:hypothetical protein
MALTASTVVRESLGSLTLHIATFATVNTAGDTWESKIPGVVACWATALTATAALTDHGVNAGLKTASTGTIGLVSGEAVSVKLFVLSKS